MQKQPYWGLWLVGTETWNMSQKCLKYGPYYIYLSLDMLYSKVAYILLRVDILQDMRERYDHVT